MDVKIGDTVTYKKYVRPFEVVEGVVVDILDDKDNRKRFKYAIKPKVKPKGYSGVVYRYHPNEVKTVIKGVEVDWIEDIVSVVEDNF